MVLKAEQQKNELIDQIADQVQSRLEPGRAEPAERFVRMFYAHVPPDDILSESPDNLYGAAMSLWSFAQKRKSDEAKINIYNPKPEEHGWKSSHTIVEILNDDMPFLVDSVTAALNDMEAHVLLVIHPIIRINRDKQGRLTDLKEEGRKTDGESAESFMHIQINEQPSDVLGQIRDKLTDVLSDVRASVEDWPTMLKRVKSLIGELKKDPPPLKKDEMKEGLAFLEWLADDHFTFLGYREYHFEGKGAKAVAKIDEDSGLGILRDSSRTVFEGLRNLGKLPPDVRDFVRQPQLLRITKANTRSSVHRPVHMDTVAVKIVSAKGEVTGERLFIGLFTSVAYSRSPREIPLLREKVDRVMERSGFRPDSHDGKALMHILESFPRDELFQASDDELFDTAMGILHLQERQRIALFVRRDPFERFVSCLVYVPRDRHDTSLRLKFQDILAKAFQGEVVSFYTHMGDQALARLHIVVRTKPGKIPDIDHEGLEWRLRQAARSWADHLEEALIEDRGEEAGLRTLRRFADGFPASYQEHFPAHAAVFDITKIEEALGSEDLAMNLYRPLEATEAEVRLKIFNTGDPVPLSDILPMLENMDLKVIAEHPYDVWPRDLGHAVWVHDFVCRTASGLSVDLPQVKEAFHDAFARVWRGDMEDDGFNRLVLIAGLSAREITILRAYSKYLRQAAIPFSQAYMEETLALNPEIARLLVQVFQTRFGSDRQDRDKQAAKIVKQIESALDDVSNLDQDRIIRRFLNAMESTLRTNFYQPAADGGEKSYASFKFDSQALEELPLPRPFREIFVYSPRIEGIHLRFGKVARGGLRWSDRREDFRTEILGLVKAQQVKNAVIVPVGSKGGFVLKRPPAPEEGREALQAEGV
ncbi:MAG: NAD-glutamate dehydrogenase, partial [Rhodovibrionaceae bacterium]|nr:NAD-glutamate dehydrogenase [Rhodovibrionaceae bacterium]